MSHDPDDLLHDLRTALAAVEPSPGFAASVRARVDEPAAGRRLSLVAWLVPVALATAAVVVVTVMRRDTTPSPSADRPVVQATPPVAAPASSVPGAVVTPKSPAVAVVHARHVAPEVGQEATVEVITNQGDVLRSVWARVRGSVTPGESGTESEPSSPAREITVDAIQVQPIVIGSIEQQGPGGAPGTIIRRVATDATGSER